MNNYQEFTRDKPCKTCNRFSEFRPGHDYFSFDKDHWFNIGKKVALWRAYFEPRGLTPESFAKFFPDIDTNPLKFWNFNWVIHEINHDEKLMFTCMVIHKQTNYLFPTCVSPDKLIPYSVIE